MRGKFLQETTMTLRGAILSFAGFVLAAGPFVPAATGQTTAIAPADVQFFESKIRPVLFDKCFSCHGDKLQRGGVRLDSRAEMVKDASALKIIAPGDPET